MNRSAGVGAGLPLDATIERVYRLELDLDLYFVPPMEANHGGITVTQTFTLPFPPSSDLAICGRQIEEHSDPHGLVLHDVVWDMDREVFTAHTSLESQALPIAEIPNAIRAWTDRPASRNDGSPRPGGGRLVRRRLPEPRGASWDSQRWSRLQRTSGTAVGTRKMRIQMRIQGPKSGGFPLAPRPRDSP